MMLLAAATLALLVGIWLERGSGYDETLRSLLGITLAVLGGCALVFLLFMLPINHWSVRQGIAKHRELQASVDRARERGDAMEAAALQHKVVEANMWLVGVQYDNRIVWDLWVPDAIEEVEVVR